MVHAGMSPMDAIVATTGQAARALRIDGEVGSIEAGKRADLIALADDPLQRIGAVQDVRLVMQGGRIVVNRTDRAPVPAGTRGGVPAAARVRARRPGGTPPRRAGDEMLYFARRLLHMIPLLFVISLCAFMLIRLGGDPMSMYGFNPNLTAEDRERLIAAHGWDQPLLAQYFYWLRDVLRGDWGSRSTPTSRWST